MEVKRFPPLNWLRTFEASARCLNFTQASEQLNLTQAAVSQQIGKLETYLGAALFERLPQGLVLTDLGLAYLPVVQESILHLARTTEELFGTPAKNRLIINSNLVFHTEWLAFRLHSFIEKYPNINLQFVSNLYDNEVKKSADFAIRLGRGDWPGFESHRLTWDEIIPVCSPDLAAEKNGKTLEEFVSSSPLIHVMGYEEGWGYWLNKLGITGADHSKGLQTDTLIAAFRMAEVGSGIALGRSSLVSHRIQAGRLVAPFEGAIGSAQGFYLAIPEFKVQKPNVIAFRDWILSEVESYYA